MPRVTHEQKKLAGEVESPYRNLRMVAFMILCALYAVCFFQLMSTLPLFYKEGHHLSEFQIGIILGYSGLFIVLFEMLIVQIAGKLLSIADIIIGGTLFCGLAFVVLNLSYSHWMLYLSITILCVSEILAMPYMSTVFVQSSNDLNRGAYMGMYSLAFSVSHIFSPYAGTYTIEHWGFETLWWATGVITVVTATGFYFLMRRKKHA